MVTFIKIRLRPVSYHELCIYFCKNPRRYPSILCDMYVPCSDVNVWTIFCFAWSIEPHKLALQGITITILMFTREAVDTRARRDHNRGDCALLFKRRRVSLVASTARRPTNYYCRRVEPFQDTTRFVYYTHKGQRSCQTCKVTVLHLQCSIEDLFDACIVHLYVFVMQLRASLKNS